MIKYIYMQNERMIIKILREICQEEGYKLSLFSDGWLILIENGEQKMFIHGYKFPNNDGAICELCTDKSGMSDFLRAMGIPTVPHHYMFALSGFDYNLSLAKNYLEEYGELVIKPNNGTGGKNVERVKSFDELRDVLSYEFISDSMLSVSPFLDIKAEYRTVVYNDIPIFTFEKERPFVIADGKTSFSEYLAQNGYKTGRVIDYVPKKNEKILLNWKHNLQGGATPRLIESPDNKMLELVKSLRTVLGLSFASVDIVKVDDKYYILEINSGVMTEHFAKSSSKNYELAKKAYKMAVNGYFDNKKI